MIPFHEALSRVLEQHVDFGTEEVPLLDSHYRVLAEDILADRDFPPFDRATKDGIAISYSAVENGRLSFEILGVLPAGRPIFPLDNPEGCVEIMTGAEVPHETDTVVMYEHIEVDGDIARLTRVPEQGQNIHRKGSDHQKGELILAGGRRIGAPEMGILATVGKARVKVVKTPRIAVVSTGNELVDIEENPLPHQIRKSNSYSLFGALKEEGIHPMLLHIDDDIDLMRQKLTYLIDEMDVLILSGGVSKGKYDFLPQVLEELGAEKIFHRVAQSPGKPYWFGRYPKTSTLIFSFPGNPVSTFLNFHAYFIPWYHKILGLAYQPISVKLGKTLENPSDLTIFTGAALALKDGCIIATALGSSGSGDLVHLSRINGFIRLDPGKGVYPEGHVVPFIPIKKFSADDS